MRRRSIATALVVLTAGLTATALRRVATRRRAAAPARAAVPTPAPAVVPVAQEENPAAPDAVVLQFTRPAAAAPAAPARCGDSGGRTRAGAPCAARATSGGRCHHHRIAA